MTPAAHHRRHLIVSATVTVGVLVSLAAGWQVQRAEHNRTRAEFARRATAQAALSVEKLRLYEEMILGLRDVFLGSSNVARAEFAAVAREILQRRPGVQALEWVPLVPASARAEVEAQAARETGRPFQFVRHDPQRKQLHPVGERPEYLPILYVEPLAGNEVVLGYELTDALTRDTLQQARRERRPLITPLVQLTQTNERVMGVIFIAPIFRPAPEDRFTGFVQGVFLAKTMLAQAHQPPGPDRALDVLYTDATGPHGKPALIYRNRGGTDATEQADIPDPTLDFYRQTVDLGGRQWVITIHATPEWLARQRTMLPWLMLAGALFSTSLAALFINQLLRRTGDIEREVAARTDDLRRTQQLLEDDIRQRTTAEQALKASEVRLQAILDHSPNSIFVKDLTGRYLLVSRQHARMWNRPAGDFLGHDDFDLFPPDIATRFRESDQQMLSAGAAIKYEITVTLPGATAPTTAIVQKFPLRDAEGRIYGMCGISTDITDRKQAEQDKIAMERKLLAAQKLESLGVLAGGIAHDFNNILTSVLANASLARHDTAAGKPVDRSLQQIELAARRAADLCQQLLAYAGKGKLASDRLDLSELVRGTAALLEVTISKNNRLDLRLADDLPPVLADPTQLRQIVMNLVINAADAITGRPGLITVTTFTRAADAALLHGALGNPDLPPGLYVGLEVTDNGSGMTPETIARIFEPFFTTKFSGRGLGLSAVLGIVQNHRGALFVESTPGQGSTFRLLLPASSGETVSSTPPFPAAGPVALRGTVLVVDDEDAVRSIAATVLEIHGATSLTAASGDEALALLRTHGEKISLVLLDLTMPGINGEETLRRMRMLGARQPVILMSGYSETETMQRSANLGVAGFIQKPFEVETLLAKTRPFLS